MTAERSILIVDDDPLALRALSRGLKRPGYRIEVASSIESAQDVVRRDPPAFAVIDLFIGESSGLELLDWFQQSHATIRSIILTGYGSVATAAASIRLGAIDCLTKPATAEQLLSAFERPIAARRVSAPRALTLARVEWEHISRVLHDHRGNVSKAASALGISRRTLQRKLRKYPPRH